MIILGTNSIKDTGYDVSNSVRMNRASTDYLKRTPSAGNRRTWTFSTWVKRSSLTGNQDLITSGSASQVVSYIYFYSANGIFAFEEYAGGYQINIKSNAYLRDLSAWYNLIIAVDTTQGTASNRIKMYINGNQVTSLSASTYPSQNFECNINSNTLHNIGCEQNGTNCIDGYLAETVFIDGLQLGADSFGEFDEDSGIWKPIDVSGLTFGSQGWYLDYEDSSALGNDVSGNNNDYTSVNLTAIDQSTDTCTNNFATFNSLVHYSTSAVFSEGNLKVVPQENTSVNYTTSTIAMPQSGKWYAEFKKLQNDNRLAVGIIDTDLQTGIFQANNYLKDVVAGGIMYDSINGKISGNNGDIQTGLTTAGNNAIIGLAVDMDNQLFYVYVNGTLINSGGSGASFSYLTGTYAAFWVGDVATSGYDNCEANFGNPPFTISSGNTDGNGYGNFEYAVPSGYYALNTKNLAEYG